MKGTVTSVNESSHSRNHVTVHVAHGKRKPKPKPKKGETSAPFGGDYDDRPTSSLLVHKKDAAKYPIGRNVNVTASALENGDDMGDGDESGEDLDDMQKRLSKAQRR